jgi:hypothetical protein
MCIRIQGILNVFLKLAKLTYFRLFTIENQYDHFYPDEFSLGFIKNNLC